MKDHEIAALVNQLCIVARRYEGSQQLREHIRGEVMQALASAPPGPSGIEAAVCDDIAQRQALGIAKYGQTVADNPLPLKAWMQHAYEEALDFAVYLKRGMAEIDAASARAQSLKG